MSHTHVHSATTDPNALAQHVTMRPTIDRGVGRTPAELRLAAARIYRLGDPFGLLAFRIADNHAHLLVHATRRDAGELARRLESSLTQVLRIAGGFEPARVRSIVDRRHLWNALRYLFRQEEHHGSAMDLAHDGSSLPDLIGLRRFAPAAVAERLVALLPRLDQQVLLEWLGPPMSNVTLTLETIREAAAAAVGVPHLTARGRKSRLACVAAVQAGPNLSAEELSRALTVSVETVGRWRRAAIDDAVVRAVLWQWKIRSQLAQAPARAAGLAALPTASGAMVSMGAVTATRKGPIVEA